MKFRTSFHVSREDGASPSMPAMPFKIPSLRQKQSKPTMACADEVEDDEFIQQAPNRRTAMQDFLKTTGANLKATGASLRAQSARLPTRMKTRRRRVSTHQASKQPPSKRNSQARSFDIKDDVLERLMGPPKDMSSGKIQSPNFLLSQRMRASSRIDAPPGISPLSGRSQAEQDRKPLSAEEVYGMFAGAPYFNVAKVANGPNRPQVIFRGGDANMSARFGTDYASFGHSTFAASSLGLHRTRETADRPPSRSHQTQSKTTVDQLLEVPSMLAANGLDPGTIGFEHFLQLPIADSAALPDEPTSFERRKLLYTSPETLGLRKLRVEPLISRLTELGTLHNRGKDTLTSQEPMSETKVEEMGEELFGSLLDPELGTTSAGTGSVSLKTQIVALQSVLAETEIWLNFSQEEWRIRVGQVLWASQEREGLTLDEGRQPSERDVLLLQITLSAELLVRMSAVKTGGSLLSGEEHEAIEQHLTKKLKWDLLLAERFLENLTISSKAGDNSANKRSSLFSTISFFTANESDDDAEHYVDPLLFPKHETMQLAGLLYFAEAIQWPHVEDVRHELEAKLAPPPPRQSTLSTNDNTARPLSGASQYMTPLSSPRLPGYTPSINRLSYFGDLSKKQQNRPGLSRMTTAQTMQLLPATASGVGQEAFEVGGWLSRSWLSGLTLPGEAAGHFLISTLLENSPQAIEVLGDSANLYGGFVYAGRSFWSKTCVVGRVLAASRGARDCMGWISVPYAPEEHREGWVDLEVKDAPSSTSKARIEDSENVARSSDPLHGSVVDEAQAGDFSTPTDGPPVMGNEVKYHGFTFTASQTSFELTKTAQDAGIGASSTDVAHLSFGSPINTRLARLSVPLTYDVQFVASYPCHPVPTTKPRTSSKPAHPDPAVTTAEEGQTPAEGSKAISPISPLSPEAAHSGAVDNDQHDTLQPSQSQQPPCDSAHTSSGITLSLVDIEKELPPPPAHPLHVDFHFDIIPVATLLTLTPETRPRALSSPEDPGKIGAAKEENEDVVVLDCRGAEDLELLARAWCAKVGENAVVGRSGRTCLACCVREARALGVSVVIKT